jgi:hypothetical protein
MSEDESGMDQIKFVLQPISRDVSQPEFEVGQMLRRRLATRQFKLGLVDIGPKHPAFGTNQSGHVEGQVTPTAAHLQTFHSPPHPRAFQQIQSGRAHHSRQNSQPFSSFHAATDDVGSVSHR